MVTCGPRGAPAATSGTAPQRKAGTIRVQPADAAPSPFWPRGRSSMAELQPSKLVMRVRFPSPAPPRNPRSGAQWATPPRDHVAAIRAFVPHTCHTRRSGWQLMGLPGSLRPGAPDLADEAAASRWPDRDHGSRAGQGGAAARHRWRARHRALRSGRPPGTGAPVGQLPQINPADSDTANSARGHLPQLPLPRIRRLRERRENRHTFLM